MYHNKENEHSENLTDSIHESIHESFKEDDSTNRISPFIPASQFA